MATFSQLFGVRVSLSSGDSFYVIGSIADVSKALSPGRNGLVLVGDRYVNPKHVCQLTYEPVPSLEIPEELVAA